MLKTKIGYKNKGDDNGRDLTAISNVLADFLSVFQKKLAKVLTDPLFNFLALALSIKILVFSCSYLILGFKTVSKKISMDLR